MPRISSNLFKCIFCSPQKTPFTSSVHSIVTLINISISIFKQFPFKSKSNCFRTWNFTLSLHILDIFPIDFPKLKPLSFSSLIGESLSAVKPMILVRRSSFFNSVARVCHDWLPIHFCFHINKINKNHPAKSRRPICLAASSAAKRFVFNTVSAKSCLPENFPVLTSIIVKASTSSTTK